MPRKTTGQVLPSEGQRDGWRIRFYAYGKRRHITFYADEGWTEQKVRDELALTLAQVGLGRWQPRPDPVAPTIREDPTFHTFASEWFSSVEQDLRPNTVLDYRWQLTVHLLPFFADHRLRAITVQEVDGYREHKRREGRLSAESINKTLTRLGQILERALEYELIDRNPVKVGRRKLKTSKATRSYLDEAAQVADLLAAAGDLDAEARADRRHIPRRVIVATLAFTGLRISEALALRWRDVDLASARLHIDDAKTDAGVRHVTLQPALLDELSDLKARTRETRADRLLFATKEHRALSDDNVRNRVFAAALKRANETRAGRGLPPLPAITPQSLRRTYISALFALGWELPLVMAEVGHSDPKVTLGVYAQVMRRDAAALERLRALLEGRPMGQRGWPPVEPLGPLSSGDSRWHRPARAHELQEMGAAGFEAGPLA